ncbi:hypothetical protein D9619_012379 [Psilocybe cf. subviscida]|uniref:DUF6535 domain-containing protein n=1 Tax=Psilocybe cf. subviscida TaxID=2480587 RepID=A0A8H5ARR5_9AGAR|nr:hypothetical protein D9619_012379 [Psilocybe cf. subviscida]
MVSDPGKIEVHSVINTAPRAEQRGTSNPNKCSAPEPALQSPFTDHLADDAKVWTLYLEATKPKGEELTRPDSQDLTNRYLRALVLQLQRPDQPMNVTTIEATFEKYIPSAAFRWINGLWFVALTFSLAGAFGSILAKGWVAQFIPISAGVPIIDAYNRHRRFFGDDQLHLRAVITTLPATLHVGFYLFFVGLILLLFQDDTRIGVFVTILLSLTMLLYIGCSLRPIVNPHSPFRTPLSGMIPIIPVLLLPVIFIGDTLGHFWLTPQERRYRKKYKEANRPYTASESLCRWLTTTRRMWTRYIIDGIHAAFRLCHGTKPLLPETGIDVLVGLFAMSRTQQNLDDCIYALAALPATPRLQSALHSIDPLPALVRNIIDIFSDPTKMETVGLPQAYLNVVLSLVQTTYSSLNWAPSGLMPLLETDGILAPVTTHPTQVLELIYCIQVHVRVRAGFLLPDSLIGELLNLVMNCTSPYHQQLLIGASFTLAAVDNGKLIEQLVLDEEIRELLIDNNIIKLLLDHISNSNSHLQCEIISTFLAFVIHEQPVKQIPEYEDHDENYNGLTIKPWMEGIFNLLLAAIVSKKHLNIQETGVSTLAKFLNLEYPRREFLQLGHLDALLGMLSMSEDIGSQLAGLKLLKVLLNNAYLEAALHTSKDIVDPIAKKFLLTCLTYTHWRPVLQSSNTSSKILHSGLITDPSFQSVAVEVLSCFAEYGLIESQVLLDTLDLQSMEEGHILAMHTELDFKERSDLYNNQQDLWGMRDTDIAQSPPEQWTVPSTMYPPVDFDEGDQSRPPGGNQEL